MPKFGVKWTPPPSPARTRLSAPKREQTYPYRTREQAEGEVTGCRRIAPELYADRSYEIVEEPDMLGPAETDPTKGM